MARLKQLRPRLAALAPKVKAAPKVALPFYQSPEWKALAAAVKAERGQRCEAPGCGREGFVIADHVIELRDGGTPLDKSNIMLLCAPCHGKKTAKARRKRAGLPG